MISKKNYSLSDLATVIDCEHKTAPTQENGTPSIRTPNVGKGRLILENVNRVSEDVFKKWTKRATPKYPDLILAREAPVGNVAIISKGLKVCLGQRTVLIRPNTELINPEFLNYLLNHNRMNQLLLTLSNGATVGHLNVGDIRKLPLPKLPGMAVQKKISAILSAYDELIENNKRRIAILENMAEEIYKEWFVRMRFLGHENASFEKGIPLNWQKVKIEDAFQITGGGTPSKNNRNYWSEGTINWYTPSDLTSETALFKYSSAAKCSELGLEKSSAKVFPEYSIMMTSRATIGELAINVKKACTNQGFITCIPNDKFPLFYLYNCLKTMKPYFKTISSGATFAELTKGMFKKIEIMTPPQRITDMFNEKVAPIYKKTELLIKYNLNLKQNRDRLLNRLISGKLDVADLDIRFPGSMQEDSNAEFHQRGQH